ncbi:MAG: radical SAM protein [Ginsengibacter sp.]
MKKLSVNNSSVHNTITRKPDSDHLRVIQIHPSLRCNLTCKHCYSSSGPAFKDFADLDDLIYFLEYAHKFGFDVTSVSGGEPFLYPKLEELLIGSHSIGNKNIAASNGMLFQSAKNRKTLEHLDLVAISIDGKPAFHDQIRNMKGAFSKMENGIDILKSTGTTFGFIHTLTEQSWQDILWLSDFAFEKGAQLLQLHPLELTGRAILEFNHMVPSAESVYKAFILIKYLQEKFEGKMKVHLDLLHRNHILNSPESINYHGADFKINQENFSDVLKCLILDEKGDIYPMSYGFDPFYKIGNIKEIKSGKNIFADFIELKGEPLYHLISSVFEQINKSEGEDLIGWTELIVKESLTQKKTNLSAVEW